jgi:5-methylcytosine-specific restriction protein A
MRRQDPRTTKRGQRDWYQRADHRRRAKHQRAIEPLCRYCRELGKNTPAEIADHVVPVDGSFERFVMGELQSLCWSCHSHVKQREERTGYRIGCDIYGVPLDPRQGWH